MSRKENIRIRQKARTSAPGEATDTNVELRHIYGWSSSKPHAAKRSKPSKDRPSQKAARNKRREEIGYPTK